MADWGGQTWDDFSRETTGPNRRSAIVRGTFSVNGGAATGFVDVPSLAGKSAFYLVRQSAQNYYDRATITYSSSNGRFSWQGPVAYGFTVFYGAR